MLYNLVLALTDPRDIACIRSIVDTMSFSFHADQVKPDAKSVLGRLKDPSVDLLIVETNTPEAEELAERIRRDRPLLWIIRLMARAHGPEAERRDARTIVLSQPVSTMRMLHAMHTAAVSLSTARHDAAPGQG